MPRDNVYLLLEQVYQIRRENTNPDVAVGKGIRYGELKDKKYDKIVDFFDQRIRSRYFSVAEQLSIQNQHNGGDIFVVMILNCVIIDILSQYRYGLEASRKDKYTDFFRKHFPKHNHKITPAIKSYKYFNSGWQEEEIKDIADAIYNGFRCSLLHSGIIAEYGRINDTNKSEVIRIEQWKSDSRKKDIIINPYLLSEALKEYFKQYILDLHNPENADLINNFQKRFAFEFGIKKEVV